MKNDLVNEKEKVQCTIFNVKFDYDNLSKAVYIDENMKEYCERIANQISDSEKNLTKNGIIYVFGDPRIISLIGSYINYNKLIFKYWIAINTYDDNLVEEGILSNHIGCLLYVKSDFEKLNFNTEGVRTNRFACPSCGKNNKDWGGKKHLVNKRGVAISDIWNDFVVINGNKEDDDIPGLILHFTNNESSIKVDGNSIPGPILTRLTKLANADFSYKIVDIERKSDSMNDELDDTSLIDNNSFEFNNTILCDDSIEVMKSLVEKYPDGLFDLVFADPPYNLEKKYDKYNDEFTDEDYTEWCKEWMTLCYRLLKPNGNMLILNLPKWNVRCINFLPIGSFYRDDIVWDSLSTPMGKIMPAHYSLIHICKSRNNYFNKENNSKVYPNINYCLRPKCINSRSDKGHRNLSNIWSDISRIKHKRDRDYHPCQLPDKLMNRIIQLYSNENDLVFDPFNGVGTTACVSSMLNRRYFSIDISKEYVDISIEKLNQINEFGEVKKQTTKTVKNSVPKKTIEVKLQTLLLQFPELVDEQKLYEYISINDIGFKIEDIIQVYGSLKPLIKKVKFVLNKSEQ